MINKYRLGIILIALTEILFGGITLIAVLASLILSKSTKPLEVLIFVLATSLTSFILGIGLFRKNRSAYRLLIFLSLVIAFSKILIFTKIISLSGALETTIPSDTKNLISIIYHSLVIFYLTRKPVKAIFGEKRKLFGL